MAKKKRRRITSAFLIGLFVIAGTAIMTVVIIWLGASQFLKENVMYVTYFEGSVEGLDPGSPVKYLGVPVGTIKTITVAPDGKLIEIVMTIDKKIKVDEKLRVKAELAGIAGGKFLQLHYPSTPEFARMNPRLSFTPQYTYIKSAPSGIDELEIAMRDVLDKIRMFKFNEVSDETVNFLQASSRFFNNDTLYQIIAKIDEAAFKLNDILTNADTSRFINNIELTSQKLLQTSVELKAFADNLNNEIKSLGLPERVDDAFAQYDTTMSEARNAIGVIAFRAETLLFTLNEAIEEVKSTNKQLKRSLRELTDDPAKSLFSNPPPPEK